MKKRQRSISIKSVNCFIVAGVIVFIAVCITGCSGALGTFFQSKYITHYFEEAPIRNAAYWHIDPENVGYDSPMIGFIKLTDSIECYTEMGVPHYRIDNGWNSNIRFEIKDLLTRNQVEGLKKCFTDIFLVYPVEQYSGENIQGRVVVGIDNTEEEHLKAILTYISDQVDVRPIVVVFVKKEFGGQKIFIVRDSYGYITENEMYIQKIGNTIWNIDDWNLKERLQQNPFIDLVVTQGYYDGTYTECSSCDLYIYTKQRECIEKRKEIFDYVFFEVEKLYGEIPVNIVLFYENVREGEQRGGTGYQNVQGVAYKLPHDKEARILFD